MATGLDLAGLIQAAQLGRSLNPAVMQQEALGNQFAQQLQQLQIAKLIRDQEDWNNPGAANMRALQARLAGKVDDPLSGFTFTEGGVADVGPTVPNPTDLLDPNVRPESLRSTPIELQLGPGGQPTGIQFDPALKRERALGQAALDAELNAIVEGNKRKSYAPGTLVATDEELSSGTGITVPAKDTTARVPLKTERIGNKLFAYDPFTFEQKAEIDIPEDSEIKQNERGIFVGKPSDPKSWKLAEGTGPVTQESKGEQFKQELTGRMLSQISDIRKNVSPTTVGFGAMVSGVPGSKAKTLQAQVDSLKANIGFTILQQMRDASKTGGALGQVAVEELKFLQNSLGSLDTKMNDKDFLKELSKIEKSAQKWESSKSKYGFSGGGSTEPQVKPKTAEEYSRPPKR